MATPDTEEFPRRRKNITTTGVYHVLTWQAFYMSGLSSHSNSMGRVSWLQFTYEETKAQRSYKLAQSHSASKQPLLE